MEVVSQNSPTTCGQACIATLLRISLEEAIKIVGHDGITSDEEIAKALSNYVVLNFVEGEPTEGTALQKHRSPDGKREHWTIYDRGRVLDPANHKKLWAVYKCKVRLMDIYGISRLKFVGDPMIYYNFEQLKKKGSEYFWSNIKVTHLVLSRGTPCFFFSRHNISNDNPNADIPFKESDLRFKITAEKLKKYKNVKGRHVGC